MLLEIIAVLSTGGGVYPAGFQSSRGTRIPNAPTIIMVPYSPPSVANAMLAPLEPVRVVVELDDGAAAVVSEPVTFAAT